MKTVPPLLKYGLLIGATIIAMICLVGLLIPGMVPGDQRASIWETFVGVTVAGIASLFLRTK